MVNNDLLATPRLSSTQKLFISYIIGWQKSGLSCKMTNRTLAEHFGMKYAGIRSMLNKLNTYKFFETTQFGHTVDGSSWSSGHEMKVDEAKLVEFLNAGKSEKKEAIEEVSSIEYSEGRVKLSNTERLNLIKEGIEALKPIELMLKNESFLLSHNKGTPIESLEESLNSADLIDEAFLNEMERDLLIVTEVLQSNKKIHHLMTNDSESQMKEGILAKEPDKTNSIVENLVNQLANNNNHKPQPPSHFELTFDLDGMVNISDILEYAEFGLYDAPFFTEYFDAEQVIFGDLINYIIELRKEQKSENYNSVEITNVLLNNLIQIIQIEESENNSSTKSKEVVELLKYILENDGHKPAPFLLPDYKININENVNLLDVIEDIGFDIQDSSYFTDFFEEEEVVFGDLVKYIIETRNEQDVEGYDSLEVTDLVLKNLIEIISEEPA
ncbi:hypothetical protein DB895_06390 [Flavobacterium psychrotolerans]|uniref:Uncharacterized protein n=2 Tax=Flavobacterium psychrotolerans TaxID=2169410 RepID=A0A2U1JKC9_9FLAO|nr:hypothetical protein DB895_06390 [Flavobacterium psychrotolerans]